MQVNFRFISVLLVAFLCFFAVSCKEIIQKHTDIAIPPEDTYMLAIGACPPWKPAIMAETCKNDVNKMTDTFKRKYGIPEKNIHVVLDDQATYDGVKKGFAWLKTKSTLNTRAVIYINTHGTLDNGMSNPSHLKEHEVLALWTKEQPFTIDFALAQKQWMATTELRQILDSFDNEKIVIMDACHSGAAKADLDAHQPLTPRLDEREALIVSTAPSQVGHVTDDVSMALFTHYFANAILQGAPNLDEAFDISKDETTKNAQWACKNSPHYNDIPKEICHQTPLKHDPYGLLKNFVEVNK